MAPTRVYFVDVGQGDCSLVVLPDGSGVLIDCYSEQAATALMADRNVTRLRAVVVTHLDHDHIAGIRRLLLHYIDKTTQGDASLCPLEQIDTVWLAPDRSRAHISHEAHDLLALVARQARAHGIRVRAPVRDDGEPPRLIWSSDDSEPESVQVELLLPFWANQLEGFLAARRDGNPLSGVIRLSSGDTSVIIGGDALLRSFEELHGLRPQELDAAVLRSPHHCGDILALANTWRNYEDLYTRVEPKFVIHSVGTHNSYGHPLRDHLEASTCAGGCHVMCTQLTKRCHDELDDARLERSAFLEVAYPDYRAAHKRNDSNPGGVPCAGTVLLVLEQGAVTVFPAPDEHREFVGTLNSPLCVGSK